MTQVCFFASSTGPVLMAHETEGGAGLFSYHHRIPCLQFIGCEDLVLCTTSGSLAKRFCESITDYENTSITALIIFQRNKTIFPEERIKDGWMERIMDVG